MKKIFFYAKVFLICLVWLLETSHGKVDGTETWHIKTKLDEFTIKKRNKKYVINGKLINQNAFEELQGFVNQYLSSLESGNCPELETQPDLQITYTLGRDKQNIRMHFEDNFLTLDDKCATVVGKGLLHLPLHRLWFLGEKEIQITLGSVRKWQLNETVFIEYQETQPLQAGLMAQPVKGKKVLTDDSAFPDWSKIQLFENALSSIKVTGRRHLSYGESSPHFTFSTNGETYTFYEVRESGLVWAVKLPDKPFLVVSESFNWGEFDVEHALDAKSDILHILRDQNGTEDTRIAALQKLGGSWNASVKNILTKILQNEEDAAKLRQEVAEALIQKPTNENKHILLQVLTETAEEPLREYISRRLRIFYPQGQVISVDDEPEEVLKKMEVWKNMSYSSL